MSRCPAVAVFDSNLDTVFNDLILSDLVDVPAPTLADLNELDLFFHGPILTNNRSLAMANSGAR